MNCKTISEFQPEAGKGQNKYIPTKTYINQMGLDKNLAGDLEMQLASYIFNINIAIYRSDFNCYNDSDLFEDEEQFEYIDFLSNNKDEILDIPLIVINYILITNTKCYILKTHLKIKIQ